MKRFIYLGYYIMKLNKSLFRKFVRYVCDIKGITCLVLFLDVIYSSLKFNISLLEYFNFRFYELPKSKREEWAGTGYMYEYQKLMNPPKERHILDDKTQFYRNYKKYINHQVIDLKELRKNQSIAAKLISNSSEKIVFKVYNGKCGQQIDIKETCKFKINDLLQYMENNNFDLVEEYIIQHPMFMKLSPNAVNTIRIFTQLNSNNEVVILGCRLRISINSFVDNMAAGNIAAPIDVDTGVVTGSGVYSDITKADEIIHPLTGVKIVGFKIPFWEKTLAMVKEAALLHPQNRSVGWDIAMTESGPDLIEGNHDWCKLVWQLPVKKGLKAILDKHLVEYTNTKSI